MKVALTTSRSAENSNYFLNNLDNVVENGEAKVFEALDVIDYVPLDRKQDYLLHWIGKLAHKSNFFITFVDVEAFAYKVANATRQEETDGLVANFYGYTDGLHKTPIFTLAAMVKFLRGHGLQITTQRIDGMNGVVVAYRP